MNEIDRLYNEYNELKQSYLKNSSIEKKEKLKNKLIELDYEKSKTFSEEIDKKFPMTTTLDKEAKRLTDLITYIQENIQAQKELINDYKKTTGTTIELSYLKSSDRLLDYKKRLESIKRFLSIKTDLSKLVNSNEQKDLIRIKVLKNRLFTEEILNLLYEFCLIDSLDITDLNVKKLVSGEKQDIEDTKVELKPKKEIEVIKEKTIKPLDLPEKPDAITDVKKIDKKDDRQALKPHIIMAVKDIKLDKKDDSKVLKSRTIIPTKDVKLDKKKDNSVEVIEKKKDLKPEVIKPIQDIKVEEVKDKKEVKVELPKKEIKPLKKEIIEEVKEKKTEVKDAKTVIEEEIEKHEQKVLTSMPIVEKIGSVVPVNVFESLKKTEEKIPNVVLPSNGLKDDQNDIFVETKDLFEESEKK